MCCSCYGHEMEDTEIHCEDCGTHPAHVCTCCGIVVDLIMNVEYDGDASE